MASINKIGTPYYSIFVVKFLKNIHMKLSELHIGFIHSVNERFRFFCARSSSRTVSGSRTP